MVERARTPGRGGARAALSGCGSAASANPQRLPPARMRALATHHHAAHRGRRDRRRGAGKPARPRASPSPQRRRAAIPRRGAAGRRRRRRPRPRRAGLGEVEPSAPGAGARAPARGTRQLDLVDPLTGSFTPRNVVPSRIAEVIAGGNAIADFPYVYGGGHVSFVDNAYDCSGSVSYALAAAKRSARPRPRAARELGRLRQALDHGLRERQARALYVDGWFDTAGRSGPYSTRWLTGRRPCGATRCATSRGSDPCGGRHLCSPRNPRRAAACGGGRRPQIPCCSATRHMCRSPARSMRIRPCQLLRGTPCGGRAGGCMHPSVPSFSPATGR